MDPATALPGRIQVSDRLSHALELLGSAELYVRMAGVYSLQQVMRGSAEHHNDIVEALAAFVRAGAARNIARDHSTWIHPMASTFPGQPHTPAPDVQAARRAKHPGRRSAGDRVDRGKRAEPLFDRLGGGARPHTGPVTPPALPARGASSGHSVPCGLISESAFKLAGMVYGPTLRDR